MWCLRFELLAKVFSHNGHLGINCELLLENTAWKSMAPMLFVFCDISCDMSDLLSIELLKRLSLLLVRLWLVSFVIVLVILSELSGDIFIMFCQNKPCARSFRLRLFIILYINIYYLFICFFCCWINLTQRFIFVLNFVFQMCHIDGVTILLFQNSFYICIYFSGSQVIRSSVHYIFFWKLTNKRFILQLFFFFYVLWVIVFIYIYYYILESGSQFFLFFLLVFIWSNKFLFHIASLLDSLWDVSSRE